MTTYIVQSYGYTHCPTFPTLAEARAALSELVREELQSARKRHKQARKHKIDTDCYRITLGSDSRSTMWSHHCILAN